MLTPLSIDPQAAPPPAAPDAGVITFAHGLPGFERCRRFVVVTSPDVAPFVCLNGLEAPQPSFLALDPRRVDPGYRLALGAADRRRLEAEDDEPLLWLALVRVDGAAAAVNLQAPIVINPRGMRGLQVVGVDSPYSATHPLPER